jgi:membrane-bound acyltransferase YfiQ involved in biofilm formation
MVALFFFYSGYGLMYSKRNKPDYMNNFLKQRFCSILIPYLIVVAIYSVVKYFYADISISYIFKSYFEGFPIANNSWFIVSILMLYFLFWLSFGVIKNWIPFAVVFTILFFWAIVDNNFIYWSYPIVSFPLGMLWARYKKQIDDFIFKNYNKSLIVILLLTLIFFFGEKLVKIQAISIVLFVLSIIFFTVLCMLVLMKLTLKNVLLDFVSVYSFEMYMIHGLYIFLFRENAFFVNHSGIYMFAMLAMTVVSSVILNKINSFALKYTIHRKPKAVLLKNNI